MPASTLPCPANTATFCSEDMRVEMRCAPADVENVAFPNTVRAEIRPAVRQARRVRYYGSNRKFVSACSGAIEENWLVVVKWCLAESLEFEHLFHGKCAYFRIIPDSAQPTEYIETYGRIVLDQAQTFDNDSIEEVEWGWSIDVLGDTDWSNMPDGTVSLDCAPGP